MSAYWRRVWETRYFWTHLALSDLRSKWRRSFLGALWAVLQPLGLTLLLTLVLSRLFRVDAIGYAAYIFTGLIVWDFISATAVQGSLAFVQADAYIKQCQHPLVIYPLRLVIGNLLTLALASLPLVIWLIGVRGVDAAAASWSALSLFPVLLLIGWPLATCLAYVGVRFRDLAHAMGLFLQAVWFVSPVYFETRLFREGGLSVLIDRNPIYHVLELFRSPLLNNQWPTTTNYLYCLGTAGTLALIAWGIGRKAEPRVIFYL